MTQEKTTFFKRAYEVAKVLLQPPESLQSYSDLYRAFVINTFFKSSLSGVLDLNSSSFSGVLTYEIDPMGKYVLLERSVKNEIIVINNLAAFFLGEIKTPNDEFTNMELGVFSPEGAFINFPESFPNKVSELKHDLIMQFKAMAVALSARYFISEELPWDPVLNANGLKNIGIYLDPEIQDLKYIEEFGVRFLQEHISLL